MRVFWGVRGACEEKGALASAGSLAAFCFVSLCIIEGYIVFAFGIFVGSARVTLSLTWLGGGARLLLSQCGPRLAVAKNQLAD